MHVSYFVYGLLVTVVDQDDSKQRYEKDLQRTDFYSDEAQARAVDALDNLYHQWLNYLNQPVVRPSVWQKLIGKKPTVTQPPQGLYMWGGVGRGKTYLMDTFLKPCRQKEA